MGYYRMRLLMVAVMVGALVTFGACGFDQRSVQGIEQNGNGGNNGGGNSAGETPEGQSDFTSAGNGGGRYSGGAGEDTSAGPSNGKSGDTTQPRTIEEGDIWKLDGDYLYVLNMYRGMQIIKLSVVDAPKLVAAVPILGQPVEMYVRDGNAYVVVSDYFNVWFDTTSGFVREFQGSQLRIVDVRAPEQPKVLGGIDIKGFVTDTRIVGEVL